MDHPKIIIAISALVFSLQAFSGNISEQVGIGDAVQLPVLADQFNNKHSFKADTTWVVLSHDMDSGFVVKEAFDGQSNKKLTATGIQYYSDISTMPEYYFKFVMLPKFKTLTYSMILGRETMDLEHIPRISGKAMLLRIHNGKLVELLSSDDPQVIRQKVLVTDS
ncbi:MAG: hypothetical protein ABFS08_12420 [Pseudomonadota bacterium]